MATGEVLPDTCAWIDFFRGRETPLAAALDQALRNGTVLLCGVVVYELLQGIKNADEEREVVGALASVPFREMSSASWIAAGRLSAAIRRQGHTVPMSDILVAVLALEHKVAVLTIDNHFSLVHGLKVVDR